MQFTIYYMLISLRSSYHFSFEDDELFASFAFVLRHADDACQHLSALPLAGHIAALGQKSERRSRQLLHSFE